MSGILSCSYRREHRSAFTLIEVLVVVAIIALLISVLLPSLARARSQARTTLCLGNLKQIGNAISYYSLETKHGYLPPYRFIRRINNNTSDWNNVPAWYQYLPYKYLHHQTEIMKCPSDDLKLATSPNLRGPVPNLRTFQPSIYWSYAINAVFPKSSNPITTDPADIMPDDPGGSTTTNFYDKILERYNPGVVSFIKRPSQTLFVLETADPPMLNPRYTIRSFYRTDHGAEKQSMCIIMADTHAELTRIEKIWPSDYTKQPPAHLGAADKWPGRFRQLWYGDPNALYIIAK